MDIADGPLLDAKQPRTRSSSTAVRAAESGTGIWATSVVAMSRPAVGRLAQKDQPFPDALTHLVRCWRRAMFAGAVERWSLTGGLFSPQQRTPLRRLAAGESPNPQARRPSQRLAASGTDSNAY